MSQASQLSPDLARGVLQLARAVLAATRTWTLYPPDHPAVEQSVSRLTAAVRQTASGAVLSIGVTPDTLLVEGAPADRSQAAIAEAAALLHDCDILQVTFVGDVPVTALRALLRILTIDPAERRSRGGPAQMWVAEGHPSVAIDQVDYKRVLDREQGDTPEPARRDDVWRSIVTSIVAGQKAAFNEFAQARLLAIAGSPVAIGDLATAVMAPKCAMDGSPMITSQAATVLAAFRHLAGIVTVMSPDRVPEVMVNLASAAAQLDPHVVMQVMQSDEEPGADVAVIRGMTAAFDDVKVAQLLATALALDGQASDRLATVFNTIAPDEDRKRRVLTLTRTMLTETDFGKSGQFQVLWTSMEELLVSYNDKPFTSEIYRTALDGVGGRAERMATIDLPPELAEWIDTLGQENVRTLSVTLLIDLLTLERDARRAVDLTQDLAALAEDLLMSGSYDDAVSVTTALSTRAGAPDAIGRDASRLALDRLGESLALRETAALLGDVDDQGWTAIRALVTTIGAASTDALKTVIAVEHDTLTSQRAADLIVSFGAGSVSRLASLVGDSRWFAQRAGARLLGRIGLAEAVPLLQPLLRRSDPRVAREAIAALGAIPDPSAARAIQSVLRSATGELRRAVIDSLVADKDARVVPMIARIIDESEPMGKDHDVVLEALDALGTVGSVDAIPVLIATARRRAWFGRKKLRALKERSVGALLRIGTPRGSAALEEAGQTGDRLLKKIIHGATKS
jgi:HEAT repeat protein